MIYKIDDKYYVRVGKDFTEVELVFKDNDVDLKPTQNILEDNGNINYIEINFLQEKQSLLDNHKTARKTDFDNKEIKSKKTFSSKMFR